ncbi:MAG TPA: hypothetical protein VEJ18_20465, partial [Planctomycetota bacterium]|nr:hypothetical protein [Planctomycetota bacterium]
PRLTMVAVLAAASLNAFEGARVRRTPQAHRERPGVATADPSTRDNMAQRREHRQARRLRKLAKGS